MSRQTFDTLLKWGTEQLTSAEVMNASLDAWYLMEHVFGITRVQFLMNRDEIIDSTEKCTHYEQLIRERMDGRPVQYIMGYTEFMGMQFSVDERVLIPRQDTEVLVETALKILKPEHRVLDMCTGSGCIILSLTALAHLKEATGADLSDGALAVSAINREKHQLSQVQLIKSDLFTNIQGKYDMIVSNPPYIPSEEVDTLMREVREHEPRMALDGSPDGLVFYKRIAQEAGTYLVPGGVLLLEIGWNQGKDVSELLSQSGFRDIRVIQDLAGLDRVVYAMH